uniref:Uncharacterized protein n=1 Tax=Arundo donax TaxID=35708 RepID=A0A0A8Y210_ARUDO
MLLRRLVTLEVTDSVWQWQPQGVSLALQSCSCVCVVSVVVCSIYRLFFSFPDYNLLGLYSCIFSCYININTQCLVFVR